MSGFTLLKTTNYNRSSIWEQTSMIKINPEPSPFLQNWNIPTICWLADHYDDGEDDDGFSKLCEWWAREGPLGQTVNYLSSPSGKCPDLRCNADYADHHFPWSSESSSSKVWGKFNCLGFSVFGANFWDQLCIRAVQASLVLMMRVVYDEEGSRLLCYKLVSAQFFWI